MEDVERFEELPEVAIRMEEALDLLDSVTDGESSMTLSELNGYLCGIAICPEAVAEEEWLPEIWDSAANADSGPFQNEEQAQAFRAAVLTYHKSVVDELNRQDFQPIYDVDGDPESGTGSGEIMWEFWVLGFARAFDLRPDAWNRFLESGDEETADAMMHLIGLIGVVDPDEDSEESLSDEELGEIQEAAPDLIAYAVTALHHARQQVH
jgi:uncharacterized protein